MFKKFFRRATPRHSAIAMTALLDPRARANAQGLLRVDVVRRDAEFLRDGLKVGGHQASCASMTAIMARPTAVPEPFSV